MTQSLFRKNYSWLPLLLVFALLLAACGSNEPATDVAEEEAVADVVARVSGAMDSMQAMTQIITETVDETAVLTDTNTTTEATNASVDSGETKTFVFGDGTEVRFYIDEVLMGQDKNVVGTTSAVAGEITLDPSNPTSAQLSPIRIDATGFSTDSNNRNGAIRRFILQSDQYQEITFEPTAITGLPETVTIGAPFEFTVTGNLTIREITNEETFQVTVTPVSETEISGLGTTTVQRGDYELTIPSVPSVTHVSEDVVLEIEFVATAS